MISAEVLGILSIFMRALGVIVFIPFPDQSVSVLLRSGAALGLSLFVVWNGTVELSGNSSVFILPVEFLAGAACTLPLALAVGCAAQWGDLFETARGQSLGSMFDPVNAVPGGIFAVMVSSAVWYLLLETIFPRVLLLFLHSFESAPPGTLDLTALSRHGSAVLTSTAQMLGLTCLYVLPIGILFLCIDLAIGIVGKLSPTVSLQHEGFAMKTAAGLLVVLGALQSGFSWQFLTAFVP